MRDIALQELLSSHGFEGEGACLAMERLYSCGLTRPGKTRIAAAKIEAVEQALDAAFQRCCIKVACRQDIQGSRTPVFVSPEHCESCGGSDNRRAVEEMLDAMQHARWTKLLVVGGSPGTRKHLEQLVGGRLELRFITDETSPSRKTVRSLLDWSEIAAVWTSTEISHKATAVLRGKKVLKVPRRGVAALAGSVRARCRATGRSCA